MKHSVRWTVRQAIRLLISGRADQALSCLKHIVRWKDKARKPKSLGDGSFLDRFYEAGGQQRQAKPERPKVYDLVCHFDGGVPRGRCHSAFTVDDAQGRRLYADDQDVPVELGISSNVAEHYSAYLAIQKLLDLAETGQRVLLQGDSMLVVKQLGGQWKAKSGVYVQAFQLGRQALTELLAKGVEVDIRWVPRERNDGADRLASRRM